VSCWTNGDAEKPSVKGMQFDLEHCKGCAICAQVCPKKAIDMLPEGAE
jgi:pyruvate ferredoxin oxidoreductase delta subunit